MNVSVVAVVVTFNRKVLLLECLNALFAQTVPLHKIIIVDNFSSDGTESYLKENGYLDNSIIDYRRFHENTGGAGGFSRGLQIALNYPVDWFWLMDDDVAAEPTCLEELLKFKDISECLHPRKLLPTGEYWKWEHIIDLHTCNKIWINDMSFDCGKDIAFLTSACFEGMLVTRRVIDFVGLPDEKYFLGEDDTIFGIKASSCTNVSYVKNAVMNKLLPVGIFTSFKSYYMIRNMFFLRKDLTEHFKVNSKIGYIFFLSYRLIQIFRICNRKEGLSFIMPCIIGFLHGLAYTHFNKIISK